jgi:hypothetical protein
MPVPSTPIRRNALRLLRPTRVAQWGDSSIGEFVDAIDHYVTVHNKDPKPFPGANYGSSNVAGPATRTPSTDVCGSS